MEQHLEGLPWKLRDLWLGRSVHQIVGAPEMLTYQGQTIREGRLGFVLPGCHRHRDLPALTQLQRQHYDKGEQCQEDWGGPSNRVV